MHTHTRSLAQYYQDMNDPRTGVYFHEKCLEISRLTADKGGEMNANHRLGVAYEKMVGFRRDDFSVLRSTYCSPPPPCLQECQYVHVRVYRKFRHPLPQ